MAAVSLSGMADIPCLQAKHDRYFELSDESFAMLKSAGVLDKPPSALLI